MTVIERVKKIIIIISKVKQKTRVKNQPAGLYGEGHIHVAEGEALPVHGAHGDAPELGVEASQLWDVVSGLRGG